MDALILSCGTGGGHDSAACAVRDALTHRGYQAQMLNPYTLAGGNTAEIINNVYITIAQRCPALFGVIYHMGELYRRLPFRSPVYHCNGKMAEIFNRYLQEHPCDVVIMTHLFPAEILTQMKRRGMQVPRTVFVATDYTCIPFMEETQCDDYIIPTAGHREEFVARGIPREKLHPFGIPVANSFLQPISRREARLQLGLQQDKRYILLCSGSMGAGGLTGIVRKMMKKVGEDTHLIVICGSNQRLRKKLEKHFGDRITLLESTNRMHLYLRACDLYMTKPGGLSSTEAAVVGIPLIHLPPIPGCENINARFFSERGMSLRYGDLENPAMAVALLDQPEKIRHMLDCQKQWIPENPAGALCEYLCGLV